ncbi:MAG: hypothetical protein NWF04_10280 [Candidatus Bathyarchaeota archaeon]|nr:hypothetical protein [Candidatus Bathyarchaeota archaeon]
MFGVVGVGFGTVINCIDGRVQLPVLVYLKSRFSVDFVDVITEPAPVKIISEAKDAAKLDSIWERLKISQEKHGSRCLAVVANYDCAANPVSKNTQLKQLQKSLSTLRQQGFNGHLLGLWVDENWTVHEVPQNQK